MRGRIAVRILLAGLVPGILAGGILAIEIAGHAPRQVAGLVEALPHGRSGLSGALTRALAWAFDRTGLGPWLMAANRVDQPTDLPWPLWAGAGSTHDGAPPPGRTRPVATIETLRQAIDTAEPGDVILLRPGLYRVTQTHIGVARAGTATAPITVRALNLGTVVLESELPEAIKVEAPHWHFENLVLKGVCADDDVCDNGFHIVGGAAGTTLRNLRLEDFNAHIKINGENDRFPDGGRIAHTTLIGNHVRRTSSSVTPIDLVAADGWTIDGNLIADFIKIEGNRVSYGAFAKGGGRGTVFTRNTILCAWRLRDENVQTIGLSFGGGGTGPGVWRGAGQPGVEHADGKMSGNLIAFCTDDGIYLNRAANSVLRNNTLIATSGIDVRYPESTGRVDANMVDGPIRSRDGGHFRAAGNIAASLPSMFLGLNPVRGYFEDPARLDLRWRRLPDPVDGESSAVLCGSPRIGPAPPGAFTDFRAC
ncbi:MAG: right-handed parallel beta-helix repeat-containing protein [Acetobacteraceae bacterium]|nr:right-handed parallel beta-helix repeat-containing protein [Acetobacteraceae bacterium]